MAPFLEQLNYSTHLEIEQMGGGGEMPEIIPLWGTSDLQVQIGRRAGGGGGGTVGPGKQENVFTGRTPPMMRRIWPKIIRLASLFGFPKA